MSASISLKLIWYFYEIYIKKMKIKVWSFTASWRNELSLFWFFLCNCSELNERQRAILEEFAKEEIEHGNNASIEGNW